MGPGLIFLVVHGRLCSTLHDEPSRRFAVSTFRCGAGLRSRGDGVLRFRTGVFVACFLDPE
jgi:hypothetical protein